MAASRLTLTALEPLPKSDWAEAIFSAAESGGLNPVRDRRHVFIPVDQQTTPRYRFADGVVLDRLWLGSGRWALSAISRRVYFATETGEPDRRPEYEITGGKTPSGPTADAALADQFRVLETLSSHLGSTTHLVDVEPVAIEPTTVHVSDRPIPSFKTLNDVYREHGFDVVPDSWLVSVCPIDGVRAELAEGFAHRLARVAQQRSAALSVQVVSADRIEAGMHSIQDEGRRPLNGRIVLFLLPKSGVPPSSDSQLLFRALDLLGVRYRRAYATDPFDYSIPDQLSSILQASGGRPHRVEIEHDGRPLWTVGVDLSHKFGDPRSTLAVTLVDPDGALIGVWLKTQTRDETARVDTLRPLLAACAQRIREDDPADPPVMILRDGRLFQGESAELYGEAFPGPVSLLEYRKGGNPQVAGHAPRPVPMSGPYAATVPGTRTMFLAPSPARSASTLPAVAKVTWRQGWNQIGLDEQKVAHTLVALTLAPGLGMHRRSTPAPIYWADGIAGADDVDLRFRGNAPHILS